MLRDRGMSLHMHTFMLTGTAQSMASWNAGELLRRDPTVK